MWKSFEVSVKNSYYVIFPVYQHKNMFMNIINQELYKIWGKIKKIEHFTIFKEIKSQKECEEF